MAHKPDDKTRRAVEQMAAVGIPQLDIAAILDITDKTLRKHYAKELATATSRANANIGGMLYKKAMDGDLTAMIFWMKTRAKWNEKNSLEVTGADGGPIQMTQINFVPVGSGKK